MKENKSYRKFEQFWPVEFENNKLMGMGKQMKSLSKYCCNFYCDLLDIKEYDEKTFNEKSEISIDEYMALFKKTFETLYNELIDPDQPKVDSNIFERLNNIKYYKKNILQLANKDTELNIPATLILKTSCYTKVNDCFNFLTMLEEQISETTKKMWKNLINNSIGAFKELKEYNLFIKVFANWKESVDDAGVDKNERYKDEFATSVSFVTNKKSRFFGDSSSLYKGALYGIVYNDKGFISAHSADADLFEIDENKVDKNNLNYCKVDIIDNINGHEIHANTTKLCTPNSCLKQFSRADHYNEVIIDKTKSKPIAIFIVNKVDGKKVSNLNYISNQVNRLRQDPQYKKLPLIVLESKNNVFNFTEDDFENKLQN